MWDDVRGLAACSALELVVLPTRDCNYDFFFFFVVRRIFIILRAILHIIQIGDVAMDVFLCDVATIVGFVPCVLCDSYSVPSEYKCGA